MSTHPVRVISDPEWGFMRLEPRPSADELSEFYQSQYYDQLRSGRAPDLRRLLEVPSARADEIRWQARTVFDTVVDALGSAPGKRVLEIGSGVGTLVKYLSDAGFDSRGVEPSPSAAAAAEQLGTEVTVGDFAAYRASGGQAADAILMLNVLEHVPDPAALLREVHEGLADDGLLIVRVPNDFSEIQAAAQAALGRTEPWWVAVPDHVSYFNYESLPPFFSRLGFDVIDTLGDFPMELFLLMGRDYTHDGAAGAACHKERVALEMALPPELCRKMYRALASVGVGRNALFIARKKPTPKPARVDMGQFEQIAPGYRYAGLRREDIQSIRLWRNAQQGVLRQKQPLTEVGQERWWKDVVEPTHGEAEPRFLLVSILDEAGEAIGYGGLTNIDWTHRRAEISFLVSPERAADPTKYEADMLAFWAFLQTWAFDELGLRRLFTETYAQRSAHIAILERAGMRLEGRLVDHVRIDGRYVDSLLHGVCSNSGADK